VSTPEGDRGTPRATKLVSAMRTPIRYDCTARRAGTALALPTPTPKPCTASERGYGATSPTALKPSGSRIALDGMQQRARGPRRYSCPPVRRSSAQCLAVLARQLAIELGVRNPRDHHRRARGLKHAHPRCPTRSHQSEPAPGPMWSTPTTVSSPPHSDKSDARDRRHGCQRIGLIIDRGASIAQRSSAGRSSLSWPTIQ